MLGIPRYAVARARRRRAAASLVGEGAAAINALVAAPLPMVAGTMDLDLPCCSDSQLHAERCLQVAVAENPKLADLKPGDALKELLHADDLYNVRKVCRARPVLRREAEGDEG